MKTKKLIYQMLTESTGTHFLDSGGENDRHWQRNQKKSFEDFENEKPEEITKEGEYYYRCVSLFHWLSELKLDRVCREFNNINSKSDNNDSDLSWGVSKEAEDFLKFGHYQVENIRDFSSYNYESDLSQVIQGSWIELNHRCYLLLQIHNGADVRGGYTKARLFKADNQIINEDIPEFLYQEELEREYEYLNQ
jgi:hypothetical protein